MEKIRIGEVERNTKETEVKVYLALDKKSYPQDKEKGEDTAEPKIDTGIGFLNHMLTLFASHGGFILDVKCLGDIDVDYHHSAEDIGIALGEAFKSALGDMKGIKRYGDIILPMDEALMIAAVDISGRGLLGFDVSFPTEKIGDFDTELVKEFFLGFVRKAEITLHFKMLSGENSHHIAESMFKAFGRVMKTAVSIDVENSEKVPSTKGVL